MAKGSAANLFWDFSVKIYGRAGVAPACLRLQDQIGADVNVLMYCCWVAHDRGQHFDDAFLSRILEIVAPWKATVVEPLRSIRRALKSATISGFDPDEQERLRTEIKRIELRSERLQQDALFAAAAVAKQGRPEVHRDVAQQNIDRYLNAIGVTIDKKAGYDINLLVEAAFDDPETDGV